MVDIGIDLYQIRKCVRCQFCPTVCPIFECYGDKAVLTNAPMGFLLGYSYLNEWNVELGEDFTRSVFECVMCGACQDICCLSLDIPSIVAELRSQIVEKGFFFKTLQDMLTSTYMHGNPWRKAKNKRNSWAEGLKVKDFSKGENAEILYFVGCTPSYDTRTQAVARSMVKVLDKAGVDFGILGNEETCCGDPVLRIGERGLFESLRDENMRAFEKYGISRIVTTSPHCYDIFKKNYPIEGKIEVQHYTQLISEMISLGKIRFSKTVDKVVTYHDPCNLGRINGIYDAPREVLKAIPGLRLREMERTKEDSFCCGGGGGGMWMDAKSEERPCAVRAREAASLEPDVIVTACPFCIINLEDGIKLIDKDQEIQVKDIIELVSEAV